VGRESIACGREDRCLGSIGPKGAKAHEVQNSARSETGRTASSGTALQQAEVSEPGNMHHRVVRGEQVVANQVDVPAAHVLAEEVA